MDVACFGEPQGDPRAPPRRLVCCDGHGYVDRQSFCTPTALRGWRGVIRVGYSAAQKGAVISGTAAAETPTVQPALALSEAAGAAVNPAGRTGSGRSRVVRRY